MSLQVTFQEQRGSFQMDVDVDVATNGITALFGPSGCGKTSLLRAIAGLDRIRGGRARLNDVTWQDDDLFVPAHHRSVGFVFQEQNLFPHLSIRRNIEYGVRRMSATQRGMAVEQAVAWLDIGALMQRRPASLSVGERQRVAIARAIAMRPKLLLMDEPLAALDLPRRQAILSRIRSLRHEFDLPIIYVSHVPDEVAQVADDVVLMNAGRIAARGSVHDIYTDMNLPLALDRQAASILDATVVEHDNEFGLLRLSIGGYDLYLPHGDVSLGSQVRLRIAARDVSLARSEPLDTSLLNRLPARIDTLSEDGQAEVVVRLLVGDAPLLARITRRSAVRLALQPGDKVFAQIKSVALLS